MTRLDAEKKKVDDLRGRKGALTAEESKEIKMYDQKMKRLRIKAIVLDVEHVLDAVVALCEVPGGAEFFLANNSNAGRAIDDPLYNPDEAAAGDADSALNHCASLMPLFLRFLGSPLTAHSCQARLTRFVKSVVPKEVISSRFYLADILQVVALNNA